MRRQSDPKAPEACPSAPSLPRTASPPHLAPGASHSACTPPRTSHLGSHKAFVASFATSCVGPRPTLQVHPVRLWTAFRSASPHATGSGKPETRRAWRHEAMRSAPPTASSQERMSTCSETSLQAMTSQRAANEGSSLSPLPVVGTPFSRHTKSTASRPASKSLRPTEEARWRWARGATCQPAIVPSCFAAKRSVRGVGSISMALSTNQRWVFTSYFLIETA